LYGCGLRGQFQILGSLGKGWRLTKMDIANPKSKRNASLRDAGYGDCLTNQADSISAFQLLNRPEWPTDA